MRSTEAIASQQTTKLQDEFSAICDAAHVWHGWGPACAYFEEFSSVDSAEPKRHVYVSYGMGGEKPEGSVMPTADTPADVLAASVEFFRGWLKPNLTLIWRKKPLIENDSESGRWGSYWRCVQLDDNRRTLIIKWNI